MHNTNPPADEIGLESLDPAKTHANISEKVADKRFKEETEAERPQIEAEREKLRKESKQK